MARLDLCAIFLDLVAPDPKAQLARSSYKRKNLSTEINRFVLLLIFTWLSSAVYIASRVVSFRERDLQSSQDQGEQTWLDVVCKPSDKLTVALFARCSEFP